MKTVRNYNYMNMIKLCYVILISFDSFVWSLLCCEITDHV